MSEKPEQTNIADLAGLLSLRKDASYPTVLFLGSRAGGLFRSRALADAVRRLPGLPVQKDVFATAYAFFERLRLGEDELSSQLRGFLRGVDITDADLSLARLIKQKLFNVIITTNFDNLLERALEKVGMRRTFDFEVVIPERDRSFDFGPSEHQLSCRIIKSFGDLSARSSYQIVKTKMYLDGNEPLRARLEAILKGDVLVVGLDLSWDQEIIRAFQYSPNSLWFVHEENLLDHPLIRPMFQDRPVKYIAGPEGICETFFNSTCQYLLPGVVSSSSPQKELVNRIVELQPVNEAFTILNDQDYVQRTPVLSLYGIGGIGKTAIVRHVARRCENEHLPYIHAEAQDIPGLARAIQREVNKYYNIDVLLQKDDDPLERSKIATRELLKRGPAVILIDSLATAEQMKWLGELLKDIHRGNRLFVVLTSKRLFAFEPDRAFARQLRLWSLALEPLNRESCQEYLSQPDLQLEADAREIVYEWTHGYPLAMQVMREGLARGLDLKKDEDRLEILASLIERVIVQKVLARVETAQLDWYQNMLGLLSFPRRFNLEIMSSLIEAFASGLRPESRVACFLIPKKIDAVTEALSWNITRAGFSVNTSVRHLFLLDFKVRQPERYRAIHAFLARLNREQIQRMTGLEQVRCLREFIYHLVCQGDSVAISEQISQVVEPILLEDPGSLIEFGEEFRQDEELQEATGSFRASITSLIHKIQALVYLRFAEETADMDQAHFLHMFFTHLIHVQEADQLPQALGRRISQIIQTPDSVEDVIKLYHDCLEQTHFRTLFTLDTRSSPPEEEPSEGGSQN